MPIEPLTDRELVKYFGVYRDAFPDWDVEHKVVLTRASGPISQRISFQALRSGAYRPSCSIWVAGPPERSQLLWQFLEKSLEQVDRRQHDTKWPLMLKAMEEQFVPRVREPLNIAEVFRLAAEQAERDGIQNIRYFNGLATLSVHLGQTKNALQWCDRAEASLEKNGCDPAEWDLSQVGFTHQLRDALNSDRAPEFLADLANQSRD